MQLFRAIRRNWWVPIVLAIVLAVAGFGAASLSPTSYTATTQILVTTQISGSAVLTEDSRSVTYVNLATSGPVLDRVILELGLDLTRQQLAEKIEAEIVRGTQIIDISVSTDDADLSADIANAVARNLVVAATDITVGELQRTLDDLEQQVNTQRDRVVVIDTRLAELDTEENADDSQVRAEIAQLQRDRLQINQTIADLEHSIRQINTNLNTTNIPVVVTDFAQPPEKGQAISPILLALLGGFVGGLAGVAWITYAAATDRFVRSESQVASLPVLGRISASNRDEKNADALAMLATRVSAPKALTSGKQLVIVTAREDANLEELRSNLDRELTDGFASVAAANGALDNAAALRLASQADAAVVVTILGKTKIEDAEELHQVLATMNVEVLGTLVVRK